MPARFSTSRLIRSSSPAAALAAAAAVVAAALILADTLHWMWRCWSALPFWDQWESVLEYQILKERGPLLSQWVGQHNEHRLVFPRLLFLADMRLFGAANVLLFALLIGIQLLHAWMLLAMARPRPTAWPTLVVIGAAVVALLVSMGQAENLIWGFQVQFVGVFACATGAYWLLMRAVGGTAAGEPWRARLAGCLALLGVGVFTMANGIVAAAVAVLLAFALRAPRRILAPLIVSVAAYGMLFFYDYRPIAGGGLAALIDQPVVALRYVARFIGNIAAPLWQDGGAASRARIGPALLGYVGIALGAAIAARIALGRDRDPVQRVLAAIMLFVGVSAVLVAAGRMGIGPESAFTTRYSTPVAIFWAAQLLYWSRVAAAQGRARAKAVVLTAAGLILVLLLAVQIRIRPVLIDHIMCVDWATDALLTGIDDREALVGVFTRPAEIMPRAAFLKQQGLSIYGAPQARWLDRPLASMAKTAADADCAGAFDAVVQPPEAETDAVRVMGWAFDRRGRRAPRRVLIVDEAGLVRGVASGGLTRPDVTRDRPEIGDDSGWRGFARAANGQTLTAYALIGRGRACRVGQITVASLKPQAKLAEIPPTAVGAALPAKAETTGAFALGAVHASVGPPPAAAYGSWLTSDGDQGQVRLGPFVSATGRIGFAMVTGPSSANQFVEIEDAATGQTLAQINTKVRSQWDWVAASVPAGRAVRLIARDSGSGWGQWMAITGPHEAPAEPRP